MTRKMITNKIKTNKMKKWMKVSMKYQQNLTQDITLVKNGVQIILEKNKMKMSSNLSKLH